MNDHHFVYFRFNDVERFHWLVKIQSASRTDRLVDRPGKQALRAWFFILAEAHMTNM